MLSYVCVALMFVAACMARAQLNPLPIAKNNNICTKKDAYYKVDGSCDSYVECTGYVAETRTCPDGFNFNPEAAWPQYPCGYPMDVPCVGRGSPQTAQSTTDCPHQFGFFKSPLASADNCGQYRQCVGGVALELSCPTGLAFNPDSSRCDWPDNIPSCNTEAFLGFSCPAGRNGNYPYHGNCYYFFSCTARHPRLLQCDTGKAFHPTSRRCVDEQLVNCS